MVEKIVAKKSLKEDIQKELKTKRMYKKIYLSKKDKMIVGVCGGIGEYFNIDPVLIRLLFVIFSVFTLGFGIIVYLLAWMIIPERQI